MTATTINIGLTIIFIIILIIKKKPFSLFFCMYLDDLTVKNAFQLML